MSHAKGIPGTDVDMLVQIWEVLRVVSVYPLASEKSDSTEKREASLRRAVHLCLNLLRPLAAVVADDPFGEPWPPWSFLVGIVQSLTRGKLSAVPPSHLRAT